ncbi:MAG: MFS transporter [Actinobacteria bacterium]|nr:MAG: MFS transporter [Actinomycetota bacterium]
MATSTLSSAGFTRRRMLILLTGLLLAQMTASIESTIVATAYPTIAADLGGLNRISWIFIAFTLTSTTTTMLWGKLSDIFGRRRFYEASIVIFMSGSLFCALAQSMTMLIWARALQGVGAGGIFTLTMTIMGDVMSPRERGRYQGYMMAVYTGATVLGPLVGGFIVDHYSWRWIFYINFTLGSAALVLSAFTLRLPFTRREHSIDYLGSILLSVWVISLLLVLQMGTEWGWTSARTLGVGAIFAISLPLFLAQEARAAEPVLPLRLFREKIVAVTCGAQLFIGAALFGVILFTPLFLQVVAGQRATDAGLLSVPATIGMVLGSSLTGRIITRTGRYRKFPIVGAALAALAMGLLSAMDRDTSRYTTGIWMLLFGIGSGMTFIVALIGVQNRVAHEDLGIATSATNFFRSLGNTLGIALFSTVFISQLDKNLGTLAPNSGLTAATLRQRPSEIQKIADLALRDGVIQSFTNALHIVFLLGIPFCLITFVAQFFLPEHPLRERAGVSVEANEEPRVLPMAAAH